MSIPAAQQKFGLRWNVAAILADVLPALCWLLLGALVAASLILVSRRLAGALGNPGGGALVAAGGLAAACVLVARWLLIAANAGTSRELVRQVLWLIPTLSLAAIVAALSFADSSPLAWFSLAAMVFVEEAVSWRVVRRISATKRPTAAEKVSVNELESATRAVECDAPLAPEVTQRLTRSLSLDGVDTLAGQLRVWFDAGQRTTHAHVAFCPPFARVPRIEYDQVSGPPARIKLGQAYAWGARLDLKLDDLPTERDAVILELLAADSVAVETTS